MGMPAEKSTQNRRRQNRIEVTIPLAGFILDRKSKHMLWCWSSDVSASGLGIVTEAAIPIEVDLVFVISGKMIPLRVRWKAENDNVDFPYRYGLHVTDHSIDLHDLIDQAIEGLIDTNATLQDIYYKGNPVFAQTWGSRSPYLFKGLPTSRSDFRLICIDFFKPPHSKNTLLELRLDIGQNKTKELIDFVGKVTEVSKEDGFLVFDVRIVEMEDKFHKSWDRYIKQFTI